MITDFFTCPNHFTLLRWINRWLGRTLLDWTWWRHQMETFSALPAICAGNSPVTSEFPTQRPVTWSFDVFFDLRLTKWLNKQSWSWWFETPSCPLWRHRNGSCSNYFVSTISKSVFPQSCYSTSHFVSWMLHARPSIAGNFLDIYETRWYPKMTSADSNSFTGSEDGLIFWFGVSK